MSDSYQAIYDAVRSRIHGCDVGAIVREAAGTGLDASHTISMIREDFRAAAGEMERPSVLYRPTLTQLDDRWSAHYGDLRGYGETPAAAMADFDREWHGLPKSP